MRRLRDIFGDDHERPPAPEAASPEEVREYNRRHLLANERVPDDPDATDSAMGENPYQKDIPDEAAHREQYPWLFGERRGVRWDFDPIELRNLAQPNTWVGMLTQSIVTQIAETPYTIVRSDGSEVETQKRLGTHPEERARHDGIVKDLPDATSEEIYDLLKNPNPDDNWQDLIEMWFADLLEIGSAQGTKVFPERAFREADDGTLTLDADAQTVKPLAIKPTPPEIWTKDKDERTGMTTGYWQFDRNSSPAAGGTRGSGSGRGLRDPIKFDTAEVIWHDIHKRTNRQYGLPPTLMVRDFLALMDLTISQEQNYFSKGSLPNGALTGENWDKNDMNDVLSQLDAAKGNPEKILTLYGAGGDVSYEKFGYNYDELQFTERMKWYARVIASVFQVPTAVVGIEPEQINYNTFQGEVENFESNTLGPYLQLAERFLNDQFVHAHWGRDYHLEFRPGMSESTRQMITSRVTSQFNANLITRGEARRELGKDAIPEGMDDEAEDGFKSDLVDGGEPDPEGEGGPLDDLALSKAEYEVGDETIDLSPPDYMIAAADAAAEAGDEGLIPSDCGTGVGDDRRAQIQDGEVGPDVVDEMATYLTSHAEDVTADGSPGGWTNEEWADCGNAQYAKWGGTGDGRAMEWAQRKSDEVAEARGEEPTYKMLASAGGSGNAHKAVDDEDPLRNTDDWALFDVQPSEVERVHEAIADDVGALFETVMSDDEIQGWIDQLAASDEDPAEKSLGDITGRVRELLASSDLASDVADAIRDATQSAASEALQSALSETDTDTTDLAADTIAARLDDRDVRFADSLANQISDGIRETVADGWEDGKTTREIGNDIEALRGEMEGWGAERIARQELQIATGEARSAFADEVDKVEIWQTSEDDRVRPGHEGMLGTWKYPGDAWEVDYTEEGRGVHKESVPGDSEAGIGCRCMVLLRDRDEVDADDYGGDGTP